MIGNLIGRFRRNGVRNRGEKRSDGTYRALPDPFTITDVQRREQDRERGIADPATIRKHLQKLVEAGLLAQVRPARSRQPAEYRLRPPLARLADLPDPALLADWVV